MQITVEKLPHSEVKVVVQLTAEETQKFLERAAVEVSKAVDVPGFRKGTAPLHVLKKHVREGAIEAHMIDIAIPDTYTKAVLQEKLHVLSRPQVKIIADDPLHYEAVVAVYPEVKVSGYEKISIKPEKITVEDKEIDEFLLNFQKQYATYKEVDRPAQKGDRMEIDFEGFDEGGASLERASSKNHPFVLGEGTLLPDFENAMYGLKQGDEKTFTMPFPEDYHYEPFRNKKVTFKVKVHFVQEIVLPELTPEFLKEKLQADLTLEQIRKNLYSSFERDKKQKERERHENELLEKITESTEVDLSPQLVEEEINDMVEDFKQDLQERSIDLDRYLEINKMELKDLREKYRKQAEQRLTLRFGLFKVYEQENIEASDAEVEQEIEARLARYPESEKEKARSMYSEEGSGRYRIQNTIKLTKLFDKYLPPNPLLESDDSQSSASKGSSDSTPSSDVEKSKPDSSTSEDSSPN